jgi:glycosyltransferase involved in cell wall biosynthesis
MKKTRIILLIKEKIGVINKAIILIPNYNNSTDLLKTLKSISSEEDIDVLIVDDGSATPPLLEELKKSYFANGQVYLQVIGRNVGISKALNIGLEWIYKNKYEFIARLDGGDLCVNTRLTKQQNFLESNSKVGLVGAWVDYVSESGDKLFTLKHPVADLDIRRVIYRYNPFVHPVVMFRANIIRAINGYPNSYPALEDWACFIEMSKITKMANIPEVLLKYEVSSTSISSTKRFLQSKSKVKLLWHHYSFSLNKTIGLAKNLIILFFPRSALTYIKKWIKK